MKSWLGWGAIVAILCIGATASVLAAEAQSQVPTKEEVVAFVQKAVDYAKASGKDAALQAFMNKDSGFIKGELYIYAYDYNGTVISHGGQPSLVGKNLIDMKDANGVLVIRELIKLAQQGSGWLHYLWPNPLHNNAVEKKVGYVMKVDDTWWLGSGYYEPSEAKV